MIALALPSLPAVIGAAYVVVGVAVAWKVQKQGATAAFGALVAWPVYLPLLGVPSASHGPYAQRITETFRALETTLADPAAGEVPWDADLTGLATALRQTDERLALIDRLAAETGQESLKTARRRAGTEIEAVLDEVVQLRVQIGLAALAGNTDAVQERLAELLQRARAMGEIAGLDV